MSKHDVGECVIAALAVAAACLAVTHRVRVRRGLSAWWDILIVGFGLDFGLLAIIGAIAFLVSAVAR